MSTLRIDYSGTEDADTLIGGDEASVIEGLAGDDLLVGGKGHDYLQGGLGNDILVGGEYAPGETVAPLTEHTGIDVVYITRPDPSSLAEALAGGAGNDILIGGNWQDANSNGVIDDGELGHGDAALEYQPGFANKMWGGAGDDTVQGANGFDTIGGGTGNDFLYGNGGADIIYGGDGDDFIYGGDGDPQYFHQLEGAGNTITETLYGGAGNDRIWGEAGVDLMFGGSGNDKLYGGDGDDTLKGGTGDDVLNGGAGDDILAGGEGADAFTFSEKDGLDIITDFDVTEDSLYFNDILNQTMVDELLSLAEETTVDGESGLLLSMSGGVTVFLVGLGENDIGDVNANAGPLYSVDA